MAVLTPAAGRDARRELMLRYLGIQRLAVIDALEVEFGPGFNVLTGETGAGKSIVVEAIGLLTGARAHPGLIRTGADDASVQAVFECADGREIVVRRDLNAQGRSRAFIDDAVVSAAKLKTTTRDLVDLHGQHDHQRLLDPRYQMGLLDAFGSLQELAGQTAAAFEAVRAAAHSLEEATAESRNAAERREMLEFQLAELDAVDPRDGEDEELSAAQRTLANAERLQQLCEEAYQRLYEGEASVISALGPVWRAIGELSTLDPAFESHLALKGVVETPLEDLAFTLRSYAADLETSPRRLEEVEARLASLERLKRKYGADLREVLTRRDDLRTELGQVLDSARTVDALRETLEQSRARFLSTATRLSSERRRVAPELRRRLEAVLAELAMRDARCEFRFGDVVDESRWGPEGVDIGALHLSANPGEDMRPLADVASGGELSRVTLGLRSLVSTDEAGKTLVFDEVDAGIGGEVANVLGRRLRALGERFQVLCITHLPQVAAAAHAQYLVTKTVNGNRTVTSVASLAGDARELEIARMIGGAASTDAVRASARTMLGLTDEQQASVGGRPTGAGRKRKAKAKVLNDGHP